MRGADVRGRDYGRQGKIDNAQATYLQDGLDTWSQHGHEEWTNESQASTFTALALKTTDYFVSNFIHRVSAAKW